MKTTLFCVVCIVIKNISVAMPDKSPEVVTEEKQATKKIKLDFELIEKAQKHGM